MSAGHGDLERLVARSLDAEAELLPLLPELLADLDELGTSTAQVVAALRAAGLPAGARVLDLGCGKGTVAAAVAARLAAQVVGIDGFPPFVQAAAERAAALGVSSLCAFEPGDLRDWLGRAAGFDAVLLLSVGPVAGGHRQTMAGLRTLVRPGGLIVIEDGFLADGAVVPQGCELHADHAETLRQLTAHGDELLAESIATRGQTRAENEANTAAIRRRALRLRARHPDLAPLIDGYVARQEAETEVLGNELVCALWVLRRQPD